MFLPDLDKALKNICQSLAPGGKFAAAVWGRPLNVPLLSLAFEPVMKHVSMSQQKTACNINITGGPFSLCDPDRLEKHFSAAGFKEIKVEISNK
jgi:SAM-dependent methyltransferase